MTASLLLGALRAADAWLASPGVTVSGPSTWWGPLSSTVLRTGSSVPASMVFAP